MAQLVERPTSAQVTISRSVSSSPTSGSGLIAQSLEPASDSVSPSLSASKINLKKKLKKKKLKWQSRLCSLHFPKPQSRRGPGARLQWLCTEYVCTEGKRAQGPGQAVGPQVRPRLTLCSESRWESVAGAPEGAQEGLPAEDVSL